jgi:hypothetical protein
LPSGGSAWDSFSFDCSAAPAAFDVHFENGGVVNEAIHGGQRHGLIGKELVPFRESLIGGDQERTMFVSVADQFEQNRGFGLILGDVGDVVEDEQAVAIELVPSRRVWKFWVA